MLFCNCYAKLLCKNNLKLILIITKVKNIYSLLTIDQPLCILNYFFSKYCIHLSLYDKIAVLKKITFLGFLGWNLYTISFGKGDRYLFLL